MAVNLSGFTVLNTVKHVSNGKLTSVEPLIKKISQDMCKVPYDEGKQTDGNNNTQ